MLRSTGCLVLAAAVLTSTPVSTVLAADWSQFRGPGGQGVSTDRQLPVAWSKTSNVTWKTELPGPGGSSPVVFGDRIFLTCYLGYGEPGNRGDMRQLERRLLSLDRASGRIFWSTPTPAKLPEQETIRDEHGYATSTPVVDNDRIYVFYGKSGVHAFTHAGKQVWEADVGDGLNGWGSAASPILYQDLVIVNASVESESLVALDRATGRERWRARGIKESWNTPIVTRSSSGRDELVVAIFGKILAFNPATGASLWSCDTEIPWYMVPGMVTHDGVIYCIGGRSGGALAVRTGGQGNVTASHRVWVGKKGSNVSSPVFHDGKLFWVHEQLGIAYCADAATGKLHYEERLPRGGQFYPAALLANGNVYYTSRTGKTFVVAATDRFELIGVNDLDDGSLFHASPAAADGRLYLRSDHALYCLGSK